MAKDIQAIKDNQDWIVIDGAPQIAELAVTAIKCADLILIPVQPSPYDIWACEDLVDIIKARQEVTDGTPKAAFIISRSIKGSVARTSESEVRLVFRHNYPAKAINCL